MSIPFDAIDELLAAVVPDVTGQRREFHRHPEIAYTEHATAERIERFLDSAGIDHERMAGTGVVARIGSGGGHVVGLRSEMDALPMTDLSGTAWASQSPGMAHACGHDGHMAILMGTARVLKQLEGDLPGTAVLIWQPAEEGGAGALKMVEAGVLKNPAVEAIFALHGWPGVPLGHAAWRSGPAMAAVDNFEIVVRGRGAHGALPHAGVDPIVTAARIVEGLQLVRSRMIDPLEPVVVTVGTINGGTAVNVIPDEVRMSGTIRTLTPGTRAEVPKRMEAMIVNTARASGADADFILKDGYPPTVNDAAATAFARDTLMEVLGGDNVGESPAPVMGGEDFAYYLERIPGSFIHLGVGDRPPLHNSAYDFNDDAIPYGIRAMSGLAARFMEKGMG